MELTDIKGIGVKRAEALNKIGVYKPEDLLLRFPDYYIETEREFSPVSVDGERVSFVARVVSPATRAFIRRGLSLTRLEVQSGGVKISCRWFNMPFAARGYVGGDTVYVCGKIKRFKNSVSIVNPVLIKQSTDDPAILPIYKVAKMPSATFAQAVQAVLGLKVSGYIPEKFRSEFNLSPLIESFRSVHFPVSIGEAEKARDNITLEETAYHIAAYKLLRNQTARKFVYRDFQSELQEFVSRLPFELTDGQSNAIKRLIECLKSDKSANALLQGDVGCGKTVVALTLMYFAALNGYQSVLMAPTEILARQHYEKMIKLFEPRFKCVYVGKESAKGYRDGLFHIKNGDAAIVVGTHALLYDAVQFNNLSLVITDEQQRFGVEQRSALENKAAGADVIVMTATPIPRTLALTLYGELEQIAITELPPQRKVVKTSLVPYRKVDDMINYLADKAKDGKKCYLVCPRIDDGDDDLTSVESLYEKVKKSRLAPYAMQLHGRMSDSEKSEVMRAFVNGDCRALVATTVIQVGVDVKEAADIAVFDAERFGLSELHQLRGRVGRSDEQGRCFLISDNEAAQERLREFCNCNDGFKIAELDFKLRGAGDFIGTRQHGGGFCDVDMLDKARELSERIVSDGTCCDAILSSLKNPDFIRSITLN